MSKTSAYLFRSSVQLFSNNYYTHRPRWSETSHTVCLPITRVQYAPVWVTRDCGLVSINEPHEVLLNRPDRIDFICQYFRVHHLQPHCTVPPDLHLRVICYPHVAIRVITILQVQRHRVARDEDIHRTNLCKKSVLVDYGHFRVEYLVLERTEEDSLVGDVECDLAVVLNNAFAHVVMHLCDMDDVAICAKWLSLDFVN